MTEENGDTEAAPDRCSPAPGGKQSDLGVADDSDEPSPEDDWPLTISTTGPSTIHPLMSRASANRYGNQRPTSPPAAPSGEDEIRTRYGFPRNEVEVIGTDAEPDPDDLDAGYAELAVEFNSDAANDERRAARNHFIGRPEEGH